MLLKIVQLGKIEESVLTSVSEAIRNVYGFSTQTTSPVDLPSELFNYLRNQYPAPAILKFLKSNYDGMILGITNKDLYAESLNFVFGQAYCPGRVAVLSLHRLDPSFYGKRDKRLLAERASKEAVHEVGHMLGLRHCSNEKCVMSFSNTIADVDRKSIELCEFCRSKIKF